VHLLSATVSPSRVLSAQDKIGQSVSREAMAEQALADKAGSISEGLGADSAAVRLYSSFTVNQAG
jgi:hypothetical protein